VSTAGRNRKLNVSAAVWNRAVAVWLMARLHDRANIEQLAGRSMIISMLIRRAGGL